LGLITSKPAMQIAWFHVFFNVTTTIILLPFINLLVFISCKIIKDKNNYYNSKNIKGFKYINNRFTFAPEIAVEQVKKEIINMANLSKINLEKSIEEICEQKNQSVDEIYAREDLINFLNVETTKFIVKLAPKLNEQATEDVSNYLHLLNDIARIGDHAKKILDDSIDMRKKKIKFNDEEKKEINEIKDVSFKIFELTFKIFENNSFKELTNFEELLEKTKILQKEADQKNFERLQNKKSDFESGTYYISIFTHFESICSHLENITDFFGKDNKNLTFNTSEGKDYVMVINKNNLKKNEDVSTVRKMNANENSINDFSEKINNSFG
jgi:phosphate:Na+ symporter